MPNGPPPAAHAGSATGLQKARLKALTWNDQLLAGGVLSLGDIAQRQGVTPRFLAQRIQPAFLAPDIMRRIISRDVPDSLPLETLKERRVSLNWRRQREMFGLDR